jgi:amino acid permease
MKLSDRFLKNRVKQIVITQFILIIPMIVFLFLSFTTYPVNFFYSGFIGIILAISMFLNGIEQYILKKKGWSISFFILSVLIILVAVQSFYVSTLKR